jgi:hypothetical protein
MAGFGDMASFTVTIPSGSETRYKGRYKVSDAGVLTITPDEGNLIVHSPSGWRTVEVTEADENLASGG